MNEHIVSALDEEIARLRQARDILSHSDQATAGKKASAAAGKKPRTLNAKARRAIADAQRKRWAKHKTQKKAAVPAVTAKKEAAAS